MPKHDEPYDRAPESVGTLGQDCGHHCGLITVGGNDQHIGHCSCPECHNTSMIDNMLSSLINQEGGVDPRGIV